MILFIKPNGKLTPKMVSRFLENLTFSTIPFKKPSQATRQAEKQRSSLPIHLPTLQNNTRKRRATKHSR